MWYAVLRRELTLQEKFAGSTFKVMAGTVWIVKKDAEHGVRADHIHNKYGPLFLDQEDARKIFTRPTKDIDSVMEESINVCEAVYC